MSDVFPRVEDLARRLVALEAARPGGAGGAVRVCEKLRGPLARLSGVAGFCSLLSRSLALAMAQADLARALRAVRVLPDGSLHGLDEAPAGVRASDGEPGVAVVAQLLGLLETFIGGPLTMRIVRDAWPDESFIEPGAGAGNGEAS